MMQRLVRRVLQMELQQSEPQVTNFVETDQAPAESRIDWRDLRYGIFVGVVFVIVKIAVRTMPEWNLGGTDAALAFLLTAGYIVYRARRAPEKLDTWGITAPLSKEAIAVAIGLLALVILGLAITGLAIAGHLRFEVHDVSRMIRYVISAFPQQFFLCSVVLVNLATLPAFKGAWRLPLVTGLLFGLAHFWVPVRFPGTQIPLQVISTFPLGFLAAWYFLRYRTILPLTAGHAILYVLLHRWVESHL
jgi:hypothetical protein